MSYRGMRAIVTGGLGFIGSNLALRLVNEGAHVTVIDPILPGCGGNLHNIYPAAGLIDLIESDIGDVDAIRPALQKADIIFNLAGEISHIHSMQFPERDLQVNTVAQLRFLISCKEYCRGIRVVYAGTRQVYGVPKYLPVDEGHSIEPVDFNGVHKFAAAKYHTMMSRSGDLDAYVLRLTNIYGPRMALDVECQGFLSTFLRQILLNQPLKIFGTGDQLRDPVYVDDAVEAFLLAGLAPRLHFRSFNIGGHQALTLAEIAKLAARAGGCPDPEIVPFPADRKRIDIGSYRSDSSRAQRELGWQAGVSFAEGIRRTLDYYASELPHYLGPEQAVTPCRMPEHSEPHRLQYVKV